MTIKTFDAKVLRMGALSRRGSLRALGAAALATGLAAPAATRAGKSGKNGRKRCQQQRGQCRAFLETFCEPKGDPETCEEGSFPCCEHFARCDAGAGIACLFEAVLGATPQTSGKS